MAETNYISSIKTSDGKLYGIKDADARVRMTEITWANLKQLRDNGQLIPGMQYRITDYNCTTTQTDTFNAGNQFDIIVTADSTNKLNEVARAIQHEGDEYFSNCNLAAWKIWYCLDNDTKRFAWADETDGKGVIYRMIDEHGNDCPYDFKNIMFKRYYAVNSDDPSSGTTQYGYNYISLGKHINYYSFNADTDITRYKLYYTFSYDDGVNINDASIVLSTCRNNVIGNAHISITIDNSKTYYCKWLNNIVLISNDETSVYSSTLGDSTIFGLNCTRITLINSSHNIFGNNCRNIILGTYTGGGSIANTFSSDCVYISFIDVSHSSIEKTCNHIYVDNGININFKDSSFIDINNIFDSTLCGCNIVLSKDKFYSNIYVLSLAFDDSTDISEYLKEITDDTPINFPQFIGKDSSDKVVSYTLDKIINS